MGGGPLLTGFAELSGRRAVVTGSSAGIGEAIAHELAAAGARVVVNARTEDRARRVAEAVGGHAIAADLTEPGGPASLIDRAAEALGGLDLLVNNAGMGAVAPSHELPLDDFRRVLELNLVAPFACAQAAAAHMTGGGVIVNVGSILGTTAIPRRAAYVSAKHGLAGLTKVLGTEWAERGIRCVCVEPGWIATELLRANMARDGFAASTLERRTPLGRMGEPEEVAKLVRFLASDEAAFVTATEVVSDGGWLGYGGW